VNVSTQPLQAREMTGYDHANWNPNYSSDDEESIETDSLRRRNIISGLHASSLQVLDLMDELWESSVPMESVQQDLENLLVALQSNRSLVSIFISSKALATIGESDQGRLFRNVGNLPTLRQMSVEGGAGSPTAIHMRVLADALSETSNDVITLDLSGFEFSSRSEVEQLARVLKARVGMLERLFLEDIVLDGVEDKAGFLDPILLALAPVHGEPRSRLNFFQLSCAETASNGASVVSPEALGAFFAEVPVEIPRLGLYLQNLGLNDNHCEVMAQELVRDDASMRPIDELYLNGNPSIGQKGYEALLGLLNRRFDIGVVVVDDQNWMETFDLVVFMNCKHNRGRFLTNGVFPSKAMWVDFLAELTSTTSHCYWSEARKLNAIWHTLREDPDLIYT
jgi:hypothetical protein